uniref:ATP-dependent DNA helicase n=1 Tax=Syphacia muris TaxID=451379 RepID=A0A0N5ADR1_9BILA
MNFNFLYYVITYIGKCYSNTESTNMTDVQMSDTSVFESGAHMNDSFDNDSLCDLDMDAVTDIDSFAFFRGFLRDDSEAFNDEVGLLGEERCKEMYDVLKNKFGFSHFRHRQKPAVVAALLGHDCFILMPTGAGKSLCYQLSAVLTTGVTVVISPLRSLIEDQKMKMRQLEINCCALTSDLSQAETERIYSLLAETNMRVKLLYVTPEKISASGRLNSVFLSLHKRNLLARFVIDEAHCVSQWGHDFRPDYIKLQVLRQTYTNPIVPIMALTATATPKIVVDTKNNLSIPKSKLFISSFVRTNLMYIVVKNEPKMLKELIKRVKSWYPPRSGIFYCLSRKDCETVAKQLISEGISADVYHAGLTDKRRVEVQKKWMNNEIYVICATIAFGMGIDKPDVRFVIHTSMPKSIEGYYQETGRAGRDGLVSYCWLMYSYKDSIRLRKLFDENLTAGVLKMHNSNLLQMLGYCENVSVCRRKLLVEHFGEVYDAEACRTGNTPCDVCFEDHIAINASYADGRNFIHIRYLSIQAARYGHNKQPLCGRGAGLSEADALRFMHKLVVEEFIEEKLYRLRGVETIVSYVELTEKGKDFASGKTRSKVLNFLLNVQKISDAYKVKYPDLFERCYKDLLAVLKSIQIIGLEGLEQIAALMPRTNSDLLQIEGITNRKIERYGAKIMSVLRNYWTEVDGNGINVLNFFCSSGGSMERVKKSTSAILFPNL